MLVRYIKSEVKIVNCEINTLNELANEQNHNN